MHPLILAAAAAHDPPLLDLDSTVFLQLVIFVITAVILSRALFRPYLRVKAARTAGIEGAQEEAVKMQAQAEKSLADYTAAVAAARSKAGAERAKLQSEAVAREREITSSARTSAQSALDAARKKIETDAQQARGELAPRADELARELAKKILGREVSAR
jgi:F-type H+-transporting ATPase subunit b